MENLSSIQKLDLILSSLKDYSQSINEIQDSLGFQRDTYNKVRTILHKLVRDGYAEETKEEMRYDGPEEFKPPGGIWNYSYKITFEGLVALEEPLFIWKNKVYRWNANKGKLKTIWKVAKIIMVILNALIIIYLTYKSTKD